MLNQVIIYYIEISKNMSKSSISCTQISIFSGRFFHVFNKDKHSQLVDLLDPFISLVWKY